MAKGKFDTRARALELVPEAVLVADRELKVDRSGDAMERVMTIDTGDDDAPDEERAKDAVNVLYQSLSCLLVDADGVNPKPEWLKANIDFEVASDLLGELMPGEPLAAEPIAPSTPDSGESP